jgi:phosphoribosyl-ATP pyrophosphohydrolase
MNDDIITQLEAIIAARRSADPSSSYVASLTSKGRQKMAQKLGEEAVEAVIAATADDAEGMPGEAADLVFHLLVLLADMGLEWQDVLNELARREGVSGLEEKASRTGK